MRKILFLIICLLTNTVVFAQKHNYSKQTTLRVATFNIRMDTSNDGENAWRYRKNMVNELIRFHDFDIFGTQEGFRHQLQDILNAGGYDRIGEGRDGGDNGEHSAIFYKKDKFRLLEKGDFWYSETPEIVSLGWDAPDCNRICSWGKFLDKKSNQIFYFFCSHFDNAGSVARNESSKLLLKKIEEISKGNKSICVGDFNSTPDSQPIKIIQKSNLLYDAFKITKKPPYGTIGTYQGFDYSSKMDKRIDYIFVTKDIKVSKYASLNDMPYFRFPSDHFPVFAIINL